MRQRKLGIFGNEIAEQYDVAVQCTRLATGVDGRSSGFPFQTLTKRQKIGRGPVPPADERLIGEIRRSRNAVHRSGAIYPAPFPQIETVLAQTLRRVVEYEAGIADISAEHQRHLKTAVSVVIHPLIPGFAPLRILRDRIFDDKFTANDEQKQIFFAQSFGAVIRFLWARGIYYY